MAGASPPTEAIERPPGRAEPQPTRPNQAGHGEDLLFGTAVALSAIHALDYAFVDREPGTTASQHLASGLMPVAVAALLIGCYPRLRPWRESDTGAALRRHGRHRRLRRLDPPHPRRRILGR